METGDMVLILSGVLVGVVIVSITAVKIATISSRSRKQRDIFAYVAEGSITPEEAASLIELAERADMRREILGTANWDSDWDRWRETVKDLFNDDLGKPKKNPDAAGETAAPAT